VLSTRRRTGLGKGALLRREGLYASLISAWREQRAASTVAALGRSCGPAPTNPGAAGPGPAAPRELSALFDTLGTDSSTTSERPPTT